jgi:hypothetical protein
MVAIDICVPCVVCEKVFWYDFANPALTVKAVVGLLKLLSDL